MKVTVFTPPAVYVGASACTGWNWRTSPLPAMCKISFKKYLKDTT